MLPDAGGTFLKHAFFLLSYKEVGPSSFPPSTHTTIFKADKYVWQGKAASKLHTHKRVAGGIPTSPLPPCARGEHTVPQQRLTSGFARCGDSGGQLDQVLPSGAEHPSVQCGKWAGTQQHTPGEKDGVAVVTSVSWGVQKKKNKKEKRETQQLGRSSATSPSLETFGVEAAGTGLGEASRAPLSSPTRHVGHSSMASSLLGNPRWARGRDHASPSHPARGRVRWKLSLKSSRQWQSPWNSPLPLQRLIGNTTTRGLECLHLSSREGSRKSMSSSPSPLKQGCLERAHFDRYRRIGFQRVF